MKQPRIAVLGASIAAACILLGALFLKSASVDPDVHHDFERRLERLEAVDTRLNQNVLRARLGSLGHYDGIVEDIAELDRNRAALTRIPRFVDPAGREALASALARYIEAAQRKELLAERFKSANAALRGSLVYFPLAARDLLSSDGGDSREWRRAAEELRLAMLHYVGSPGDVERARASRLLAQLESIPLPGGHAGRMLDNTRIHARNILSRQPEIGRLMSGIIDSPTAPRIQELRASYASAALRAQEHAHFYRVLLYLCSVALITLITWAFSALGDAKARLEQANADLDRRVQERTLELEELNEALEASRKEQLALKDRFLSHVSHELRTPLAAIHQFIELLRDGIGGGTTPEQHEYLSLAFKNVEQLDAMISDLTDLTRAHAGKLRVDPKPLCLHPLLDEILQAFASRSRTQSVALTAQVEDGLPSVLADATRVRQVLNNLVENAFKFTPAEGRIEIRAGRAPNEPGAVCISVRDTGRGISKDQLDKVFDRLHQVSSEDVARSGLGLGLSICRELIGRHDGRIWVESEPGRGSTFHFTLPVFSVAELVRPAVQQGGRLRSEYGILRVRLGSPRRGGAPSPRRWLSERVRRLAFYPEDVLVPSSRDDDIFLVAATDASGMQALRDRVARSLSQDEKLAAHEVTVDFHVERPAASESGLPADAHFDRAVQRIERLIENPEAFAA